MSRGSCQGQCTRDPEEMAEQCVPTQSEAGRWSCAFLQELTDSLTLCTGVLPVLQWQLLARCFPSPVSFSHLEKSNTHVSNCIGLAKDIFLLLQM